MIPQLEGLADNAGWAASLLTAAFVAGVVIGVLLGLRFDVMVFQKGVEKGFEMAYRQFMQGEKLKRPPD